MAHQRAGGEIAVAAEILGGAVHDDIGAQRQRLLVHRRGEGVVDRDQGAMGMGAIGDGADVEQRQRRVGRCFEQDQSRAVVEQRLHAIDLFRRQEMGGYAQQGQLHAQQFQGAAIGLTDAEDPLPSERKA